MWAKSFSLETNTPSANEARGRWSHQPWCLTDSCTLGQATACLGWRGLKDKLSWDFNGFCGLGLPMKPVEGLCIDIIPGFPWKKHGDESWIQRYRTSGNMVISHYPSSYVKTWPKPVTASLFDEEGCLFLIWFHHWVWIGLRLLKVVLGPQLLSKIWHRWARSNQK